MFHTSFDKNSGFNLLKAEKENLDLYADFPEELPKYDERDAFIHFRLNKEDKYIILKGIDFKLYSQILQ